MFTTYVVLFVVSIGLFSFLGLANQWFGNFLNKINRQKAGKIPVGQVYKTLLTMLISAIVALVFYLFSITATAFLLLLVLAGLFVVGMLLINLYLHSILLHKDAKVLAEENTLEDNYQFIKGLY
jgi:hypothetical protein